MNKNEVELLGYYGSDITHACSAWTSTTRDLTEEKIQRIPSLLKMLAKEGHHSPYEKSSLHFLVDSDIASHIHLLKHRIAVSINAESARYKELKEDKFYIPDDWDGIKVFDPITIPCFGNNIELKGEMWTDILEEYTKLGNELYHHSLNQISEILGRKRAKESCRFFKTYNSQIESDIMFNWRSFMHFMGLRNSEHAQKEIREIAQIMLELVKNIEGNPFKYSLEAFNY